MKSNSYPACTYPLRRRPGLRGGTRSPPAGSAIFGFDAGVSDFNGYKLISFAFNGGFLGSRGTYLGGQFVYSYELLIPPFWDGKHKPTEDRVEANVLLGKLFNPGLFYLKASGGIGFFHEVRRGKPIDFYPGIYP